MRKYETFEDARSLAREILVGTLAPNLGCTLIATIAEKLSYPPVLDSFLAIAHDQVGHEELGITAESCIGDIVEACQQLIDGEI